LVRGMEAQRKKKHTSGVIVGSAKACTKKETGRKVARQSTLFHLTAYPDWVTDVERRELAGRFGSRWQLKKIEGGKIQLGVVQVP